MLGLNPEFRPRFSRRFADGAALVREGAKAFAEAVKSGGFPSEGEGF
jgi:ketopantoate hydroxymethyltransferase